MGLLSSECERQVAMPLMLSGGGRAARISLRLAMLLRQQRVSGSA